MQHHTNCDGKSEEMKYNSPDQKKLLEKVSKGIDLKFDLMCFSCCVAFLEKDRGYICQEKGFENVSYQGESKEDVIEAELKMPSKPGKHHQIQIKPLSKNNRVVRAIENGRTYQAYYDGTGGMGVSHHAILRMESIDIRKGTSEEVENLVLSYEDAILIEIYRMQKGINSLSGSNVKGYLGIKKFTSKPMGKGDIRYYFQPKQEPSEQEETLNQQ